MSLPVTDMVQAEKMEHSECILCGTCIDGCPKSAIHYSFSSGK
jgi:ferredoxin